jgi:hypothetical protein
LLFNQSVPARLRRARRGEKKGFPMKKMSLIVLLSAFCVSFVVGCGSNSSPAPNDTVQTEMDAAAPDPHDIPLTDEQKEALRQGLQNYPDAVAKINSYRDAIRDAVSAGTPTQAHRPLDELDVVLEHMPEVARSSNIPKTQWETVNTSAQALRDSFNKLHAQIDAGEQSSYEAVAADIDAAISRLESVPASQ